MKDQDEKRTEPGCLHERLEAIRARHARLAASAAVPDKSAPAFGTDDTGVLLIAIDRLTRQCAALASLAERRGAAIERADAAEFVERLERAHDVISERHREAEVRERAEEAEWLDRLDTLLAGAETALYGERRWQDRAWREGVEATLRVMERRRNLTLGSPSDRLVVAVLMDEVRAMLDAQHPQVCSGSSLPQRTDGDFGR